jgi:hypothetical protein
VVEIKVHSCNSVVTNSKVAFMHTEITTLTHIKYNLILLGFDTISKSVQRQMMVIIPSCHLLASRTACFQVLLYVPLALTQKLCTMVGIISRNTR